MIILFNPSLCSQVLKFAGCIPFLWFPKSLGLHLSIASSGALRLQELTPADERSTRGGAKVATLAATEKRRGNGKLRWKWNLKIGHHYKYHYKYHYHKFSSTRWRSQGDGTVQTNSGAPGGVDPRRTAARADHGAQTRHVLGSQLEWLQWIVLNWLLNLESRGYHS